jgi:hypothetical protein
LPAKIAPYKINKQPNLALGQLSPKRQHAVPAVSDLLIDLALFCRLETAFSQAWDQCAVVERPPQPFRAMADRTVLPKK